MRILVSVLLVLALAGCGKPSTSEEEALKSTIKLCNSDPIISLSIGTWSNSFSITCTAKRLTK